MIGGAYLLIFVATLVRDELGCAGGGIAAARGDVHWPPTLALCYFAIVLCDVIFFVCGRYGGTWLLTRRPLSWLIPPDRLAQATDVLSRRGPWMLVCARYLPVVRTPLHFASGLLIRNVPLALVCIVVAAVPYTLLFFTAGYLLDEAVLERLPEYQGYGLIGVVLLAIVALLAIRVVRKVMAPSALPRD